MGFIDSHEGDVDLSEKLDIFVLGERFRRNEQQFGLAVGDILLHLLHLRLGQRGVEEMRHFVVLAVAPDGVHLVLHQRDKRRNDDSRPRHHQGGELVTQGLSAAGGHDDESVLPV